MEHARRTDHMYTASPPKGSGVGSISGAATQLLDTYDSRVRQPESNLLGSTAGKCDRSRISSAQLLVNQRIERLWPECVPLNLALELMQACLSAKHARTLGRFHGHRTDYRPLAHTPRLGEWPSGCACQLETAQASAPKGNWEGAIK
jgi:hypothetical protein